MTILERIVRAIKPAERRNTAFEEYYTRLVQDGTSGLPTAREALRDFDAAHSRSMLDRYL